MKPIKLSMYGFMTYKEKTEIDFTKLYPSRIFVISGDTGSGKTSIFDAISFALFGEISRPDVKQIDLRCDFLSEEDPPTFVNFIFEVDGKVYEIERKPFQYAKRKVRPGVKIDHEVALYKINKDKKDLLSDKTSETKDLIKEIIGLDQNQLKKVMLLAQGQFSEFLSADSRTKADLLSDIFQTSQYGDIQEILKDMASSYSQELKTLDQNMGDALKKDDNIYILVDQAMKDRHDFDKIVKIIKGELDKKEETIGSLNEEYRIKNDKKTNLINEISKIKQENEQIIIYKNLLKEKENFDGKLNSYEALKNSLQRSKDANSIRPYYERLDQIKKDIERITLVIKEKEIEKEKFEKDFIILLAEKENLKIINTEVDQIKIDLNSYMDKEKSLEKFLKLQASYDEAKRLKEKLTRASKDLEIINEKDKDLSEEILSKSNDLLEEKEIKSKLLFEKNENNNKLEKNLELINKVQNNLKLKEEIKTLEEEVKKLDKNILQAKKDLDQGLINQENIEKQKFIRILNQTKVCPICGSIHNEKIEEKEIFNLDLEALRSNYHKLVNKKDLAKNKISLLSKNLLLDLPSLENLNLERKNLLEESKEIENKLHTCKENLEETEEFIEKMKVEKNTLLEKISTLNNQINLLKEKLVSFDETEKSYLAIKDNFKELDKEKIRKKIESLTKTLDEKSKKIEKVNKDFSDTDKKLTEIKSFLATSKDNLLTYQKSFKENQEILDKNVKKYFSSMEDFLENLDSYDKLIEKEKAIDEFFDAYKTIKIKLESLSIYKDKEVIDLNFYNEKLEEINVYMDQIRKSITKENINFAALKDIKEEISNIEKSYKEKSSDSQTIARLAKIASGANGAVKGREKLDFETFVLIYYFEKILSYSNQRLSQMSDGQYRMIRKTSGGDMRSKQGLDIEIIDANTGKKRPASTLSGGETFLASLALALGLSDEISAENGGIKIDTLFIDEGFGSLSDNYLDNAIRTIEKLSYENKFIGLISHVKEVKDAIDAKILVKYDKSRGSEVEIII